MGGIVVVGMVIAVDGCVSEADVCVWGRGWQIALMFFLFFLGGGGIEIVFW